jgi:hypothetical protein
MMPQSGNCLMRLMKAFKMLLSLSFESSVKRATRFSQRTETSVYLEFEQGATFDYCRLLVSLWSAALVM